MALASEYGHEALHRRLLPQPRAAPDLRGGRAAAPGGDDGPRPCRGSASSRCSGRSRQRADDRPAPDRPRGHGRPRLHAAGRDGHDRGPRAQRGADRGAADDASSSATTYVCITHGNGPQVGNLLLQQEQAGAEVPALPLDVLVAMTEGSLGYILQQALLNELRKRQMQALRRHRGDPGGGRRGRPGLRRHRASRSARSCSREEAERRRDAARLEDRRRTRGAAGAGWCPSPSPAQGHPAPHDPRRGAAGPHRRGLRRWRDPGQDAGRRPVRRASRR